MILLHHNLKARLIERATRLYESDFEVYDDELRYFLTFLVSDQYIWSVVKTIESEASVDFENWNRTRSDSRTLKFPATELGRAKVCFNIITHCVSQENNWDSLSWAREFSNKSNFNEMLHEFNQKIIGPFVSFLCDRINDGSIVLYLIERFKLEVEWFKQSELYDAYRNDTSSGERNLELALRASLFNGGIDYPFSQPSSPSGNADVIALVGTADPLVLEVKVFDPARGKRKNNLRQGFHQVLRYANDYNEGIGYLVIFNCSGRPLAISPIENTGQEFPTRITHTGKTFFIVTININPDQASASKENPASRVVVSAAELVGQ